MTTKKTIVIKSAGTPTGILQFPTEQDILDAIPLLDRGDENFIEIILENVDDSFLFDGGGTGRPCRESKAKICTVPYRNFVEPSRCIGKPLLLETQSETARA